MFNAWDYGRVIELFNLLINKYPQSPFLCPELLLPGPGIL